MYMINVKQQIEGRPSTKLIDRRYRVSTLADLADWCHAFIRACEAKGWFRVTHEKLPGEHEANLKEGFTTVDLGQFTVLRRGSEAKVITIEIFPTEPAAPDQAAALFTR